MSFQRIDVDYPAEIAVTRVARKLENLFLRF